MDGIIGNEGPFYILIGILMAVGVGTVVRNRDDESSPWLLLPLISSSAWASVWVMFIIATPPLPKEPSIWGILGAHFLWNCCPGILYLPVVGILSWSMAIGEDDSLEKKKV